MKMSLLTWNRCACGAEFCYLCGAPWKSCSCDHAEEAHLVEEADHLALLEDEFEHERGMAELAEGLIGMLQTHLEERGGW